MDRPAHPSPPGPVVQDDLGDLIDLVDLIKLDDKNGQTASPVARNRTLLPGAPVSPSLSPTSPADRGRSPFPSRSARHVEPSPTRFGILIDLEDDNVKSPPSGPALVPSPTPGPILSPGLVPVPPPASASTTPVCLHRGKYTAMKGLACCPVKSHPTCLAQGGRTFCMLTCKRCGFKLCNRCVRAVTDHTGSRYGKKRVGDVGYQGNWTRPNGPQ